MDNFDDMLKNLNADLNRQMEELNKQMADFSSFDLDLQTETSTHEDAPQHFCPQCGNTVTKEMMFCPKCGCKLKQDETPVEQDEETPSAQKKNFILWFEFRYDKQVVFKEIPTEENVQSYKDELESDYEFELTDGMFANGLLTEDGMQELLIGASDLVSRELATNYDPVVSEILACRVIPNPSGLKEWYNDDVGEWDNSEEIDPDEISLEVDDYDDSEYKARAVYHMHEVHDMFSIQLDDIADFDPSKVVIRDGHEDGSDFNAYYDGEMLKFLGVGKGDDNFDYEEEIELVKYESPSGEEQEPSSDADSCSGKINLQLFPEAPYRLYLFPIIGEDANERVDNEGFDVELSQELEQEYSEQTERKYDIIFDFYASDDGMYYSIDDGDQDELEDNAINIDRSKYDLEEWEEEPDDDFRLIDKLQKDDDLNEDNQEVFNDIMNRHNNEEHVDIIVEAICRRLQRVAQQLVDEGLAEDVDSVRFGLWYGQLSIYQYEFQLETDDFNPEALKMIDCTDWNDCHVSDVLQEHWPDRLAACIIYDGKFYQSSGGSVDNFNFNADLVDRNLKSLL